MYVYNHPNSYKDVAHYQQVENQTADNIQSIQNVSNELIINNDVRVIGVKNITTHAGATSLIYMMKNILAKYYSIMCIEVNKRDFMFYKNKDMISVIEKQLSDTILKYKDVNIILVDLNNLPEAVCNNICTDILYLVEPSLFRINKLITLDRDVFVKFNSEKIILNKSFFTEKDVKDFEFEGDIKIFYNIPPLNDRIDNSSVLMPFLEKLGLFKRDY